MKTRQQLQDLCTAYVDESWELNRQRAALELVNRIRNAILEELTRMRTENCAPEPILRVPVLDPSGNNPEGIQWVFGIFNEEYQRRTLEQLLRPHVEAGKIPNFRPRRVDADVFATCMELEFDFPF